MLRQVLLLGCLLIVSIANAQTFTTTIDYQSWSGASGCNIFSSATNVPANFNGSSISVVHQSTVGQPVYNGTDNAVQLGANIVNNERRGTEYRIAYNFKQNYNYTITINASRVTNTGDPSLRINFVNSTGAATDCTGTGTIDNSTSGGLIFAKSITSTTFTDYQFQQFTLTSDQSYLTIAALDNPASTGVQTINIRKITIVETPNYTISPSSVPVVCGTTPSQTFTITPNNVSGVTSYVWNLNTTSNGWIYGTTSAPQTITTLTNSLTLTPDCGKALQSISVAVKVGSTTVKTLNVAVSTPPPTFSMTGSGTLCSGNETYTVPVLPCNASVSWSVTPAGIVSLSVSNGQATLTQVGNGQVTLTAVISGASSCYNNITLTKPIAVGLPDPVSYIYISGADPMYLCPYTNYAAIANPTVYTQYEWYLPMGWTVSNASGTNPYTCYDYELDFQTDGSTSGPLVVRRVNGCGGSDYTYLDAAINCGYYFYTMSPNPATSEITIDGTAKNKAITNVEIMDKHGNLKKSYKFSGGNKRVKINIASLPVDLYFVRIYDGKKWESKPFNKQ